MLNNKFDLISEYTPSGDQPKAIDFICNSLIAQNKNTVLLGVTGSGKTYTIANVIEKLQRTSLILAPNKILAAQLYAEMKSFFPYNAVEYFVSYYDYYQPEAYIPRTDTFIDKEATINEQIDQMRHKATCSLLERRDVIIVASVSCIYGIGSPKEYGSFLTIFKIKDIINREDILKAFVKLQYDRAGIELKRGTFRVNGDIIDIYPAHMDEIYWRILLEWDEIIGIDEVNLLSGNVISKLEQIKLYPNTHFVVEYQKLPLILEQIKKDLDDHVNCFEAQGKFIEAQRIRERVSFDLEMLKLTGHCRGIENYTRYLNGSNPGDPPPTLFDYLPHDALLFVDESHVSIPQISGMYNGDAARKKILSEYGFRLEACKDNRPLKFEEWDNMRPQTIYVSATPGKFEIEKSNDNVIEQIIRPTGLIDPVCVVKTTENQIDDLISRCRKKIDADGRVLITTLTKKMAESLCEYLNEVGIKTRYMHSDIETLERIELIKQLKKGTYSVLVGINLLREGLDIPECTFVAILDADKEGFLRSETSIIQTIGRAARNIDSEVVLYADKMTKAMKNALHETNRRRILQIEYNRINNIIPQSIVIKKVLSDDNQSYNSVKTSSNIFLNLKSEINDISELKKKINSLEKKMRKYAQNLNFEKAAILRDEMKILTRTAEISGACSRDG